MPSYIADRRSSLPLLEPLEPRQLLQAAPTPTAAPVALASDGALGADAVPLHGVFTGTATNSNSYTELQKFDYTAVELRVTFTAPSGRQIQFFGYHAGDGSGGQTGNVWRFRCMPDEVGTWTYSYTWTDGHSGGNGSFGVQDTGLPGPLKIASDNPWYFDTARGAHFDARPYDLHHFKTLAVPSGTSKSTDWTQIEANYISMLTTQAAAGYNLFMLDTPGDTNYTRNYFYSDQVDRFDVKVWDDYEAILLHAVDLGVYCFPFDGMVAQWNRNHHTDKLIRYFVARYGAISSHMGWSPTWEFTEIWSNSYLDSKQGQAKSWNPFPILLSVHDHSDSSFSDWMGFSMRQLPSNDIFDGNSRTAGKHGGIEAPMDARPIIGSEDIWQDPTRLYDQPGNATEVRRGAWGIMMAGVIPLYSEWFSRCDQPGNMSGEAEVVRMLDFVYGQTDYRRYQMLNSRVSSSARQICSGVPGQEYLVYDEDGGSITVNLGTDSGKTFDVLWFDAANGATQTGTAITGGGSRTLTCAYGDDSVLLLTARSGPPDTTAPSAVTDLSAGSPTSNSIQLSWTAPGDDGSAGTAAGYDIRYSTSPITAANWAGAAQVQGEPAPAGAGTPQSMTVAGLLRDTTYYFAIRAVDEAANVSGLSNVASATTLDGAGSLLEVGGELVIEAENFDALDGRSDPGGLGWAVSAAVAGFSGAGYLTTPDIASSNGDWANACEASYQASFSTTGSYSVWIRRNSPDGAGNSAFLGIDGTACSGYDNGSSDYGVWTWVKLGTMSVASAGVKTVQIRRREDGQRIDKILLTTGSTTPSGTGPAESARDGGTADTTAPTVTGATLDGAALWYISGSVPGGSHMMTLAFSEPVTFSGGAAVLERVGGGTVAVGVSGSGTETMTVSIPQAGLADGDYRLRLVAGDIEDAAGNALDGDGNGTGGDDYTRRFHRLRGDIDGDRQVGLADLAILATHWNGSAGKTTGDLTGDGKADLADLAVVATNWNTTLGAAPLAAGTRDLADAMADARRAEESARDRVWAAAPAPAGRPRVAKRASAAMDVLPEPLPR